MPQVSGRACWLSLAAHGPCWQGWGGRRKVLSTGSSGGNRRGLGDGSRLMPALQRNSLLLSLGTCRLSHPWVWHELCITPNPAVGREEGGRTPNLMCGGSGIMLSRAVEPCYLSEPEPAWPHLGMSSGFGPGVIPLEWLSHTSMDSVFQLLVD